jgi:hypothetical protein
MAAILAALPSPPVFQLKSLTWHGNGGEFEQNMRTFLSTQTCLDHAIIGPWNDTVPIIIPSLRTVSKALNCRDFPVAFVNGSVRHIHGLWMPRPPKMTDSFKTGLRSVLTLTIRTFNRGMPALWTILDMMVPYLDNLRYLHGDYGNLVGILINSNSPTLKS